MMSGSEAPVQELTREQLREASSRGTPPEDFREFWQTSGRELASVAPSPRPTATSIPPLVTGAPQPAVPALMYSLDSLSIRCWFSRQPPGPPPPHSGRPLLVTCHGYGGQVDRQRVRRLGTFGFDVVAFDARGFGESRKALPSTSAHGYLMTGYESPWRSILRGAVCDYLQAARAAVGWYGRPTSITFQGFSFAGGLAVMAAGVASMANLEEFPRPNILAIGAPTFGNNPMRLRLCETGSGREMADFVSRFPEKRAQALETLNYFDTVHFAPHVDCRVIAGVGLFDPVVPAVTVYSIINALPRPPELHEMPCSHTTRPEEQQWIRWESSWIRATQGRTRKL